MTSHVTVTSATSVIVIDIVTLLYIILKSIKGFRTIILYNMNIFTIYIIRVWEHYSTPADINLVLSEFKTVDSNYFLFSIFFFF